MYTQLTRFAYSQNLTDKLSNKVRISRERDLNQHRVKHILDLKSVIYLAPGNKGLINALSKHICNFANCSICSFKTNLVATFCNIPDLPYIPGFNNSLDRGDCSQRCNNRMT